MTSLKKPNIILMPISEKEKEAYLNDFLGDESVYVLYKLPESNDIHIGMISSSMRIYFPLTANALKLDEATTKAYFYNGGAELERKAMEITDRPVYRIRPTDERTVSGYDVINGTPDNGLRIWLDDVVDGNYTLNKKGILSRIKRWLPL